MNVGPLASWPVSGFHGPSKGRSLRSRRLRRWPCGPPLTRAAPARFRSERAARKDGGPGTHSPTCTALSAGVREARSRLACTPGWLSGCRPVGGGALPSDRHAAPAQRPTPGGGLLEAVGKTNHCRRPLPVRKAPGFRSGRSRGRGGALASRLHAGNGGGNGGWAVGGSGKCDTSARTDTLLRTRYPGEGRPAADSQQPYGGRGVGAIAPRAPAQNRPDPPTDHGPLPIYGSSPHPPTVGR